MGDIVNLRRFRKAQARAADVSKAEANRVLFGQSKHERTLGARLKSSAERRLEGHRLTRDEPDQTPSE